jgi:hypothetical protein
MNLSMPVLPDFNELSVAFPDFQKSIRTDFPRA